MATFIKGQSLFGNFGAFEVVTTNAPTAGTPVQLPNIPIPGDVVVLLYKSDTEGGITYVANSSANTLDATKRFSLSKGDQLALRITNTNLIWINGNKANQSITFVTEI